MGNAREKDADVDAHEWSNKAEERPKCGWRMTYTSCIDACMRCAATRADHSVGIASGLGEYGPVREGARGGRGGPYSVRRDGRELRAEPHLWAGNDQGVS